MTNQFNKIEYELKECAKRIRKHILDMTIKAGSGHIAPAFSIVDILVALYFAILKVDPKKHIWEERDRFILSKGHGCAALYAVLSERGYFPVETLLTFSQLGSKLGGHPEMQKIRGVEASTGSLGHGLSIGVGISIVGKVESKNYRVFVLVGDGECQEGSIWEAAMCASQFNLDNLVVIVDHNGLQATGLVEEIISVEPLTAKWVSFGWSVKEIDGHNLKEIIHTLNSVPFEQGKPNVIIAHTIKGKGVTFMENNILWHYRIPNKKEAEQAYKELNSN